MPEPRDWWHRHPDDWEPISTLPKSGGPFVLANEAKDKMWLSEGAKKRDSDPHPGLDPDDPTKVNEEGDVPAFWARP